MLIRGAARQDFILFSQSHVSCFPLCTDSDINPFTSPSNKMWIRPFTKMLNYYFNVHFGLRFWAACLCDVDLHFWWETTKLLVLQTWNTPLRHHCLQKHLSKARGWVTGLSHRRVLCQNPPSPVYHPLSRGCISQIIRLKCSFPTKWPVLHNFPGKKKADLNLGQVII